MNRVESLVGRQLCPRTASHRLSLRLMGVPQVDRLTAHERASNGVSRQTGCMGPKDRGPRPKPEADAEFCADLRAAFAWRGDRPDDRFAADLTGWWANASILSRLGPALAKPYADHRPTLVLGPQSRGALLGALVAAHLRVGLVELRKDPLPAADSDRWLTARTPPDYQDRNLQLGVRRDLLPSTARVSTIGSTPAARPSQLRIWSPRPAPPGVVPASLLTL